MIFCYVLLFIITPGGGGGVTTIYAGTGCAKFSTTTPFRLVENVGNALYSISELFKKFFVTVGRNENRSTTPYNPCNYLRGRETYELKSKSVSNKVNRGNNHSNAGLTTISSG